MKRIKGNMKLIIGVIIGILISVVTSYAIAETLIKSVDVSYVDNSRLGATNVQAAIDGTCTKFSNDLSNFLNKIYPIGSIYISTASTNPSTFLGGTWEAYGQGRTLVGVGSNGTNSYSINATGGSSSVTLSTSNLPAHTHSISHTHTTEKKDTTTMSLTANTAGAHTHSITSPRGELYTDYNGSGTRYLVTGALFYSDIVSHPFSAASSGNHTHTVTGSVTIPSLSTNSISTDTSGSTGSGASFSVQDPYVVVYMWRRKS